MVTDEGGKNENDCFRASRSYERAIVQFHMSTYYNSLEQNPMATFDAAEMFRKWKRRLLGGDQRWVTRPHLVGASNGSDEAMSRADTVGVQSSSY